MFDIYPIKTYSFEEGMTFEEFCNSSYNIDNWKVISIDSVNLTYILHQYDRYVCERGSSVRPYDIIKPNGIYGYDA